MKVDVRHLMKNTVLVASRLLLALTFIVSGFSKLDDPMGMVYKLSEYANAFNLNDLIPHPSLLLLCATLLGIFEFMLGILTLFAANRRTTTTLLVIFLIVMTMLTLYLAVNDPIKDCGCFGGLIKLSNWQTFWKNVILLLCAIVTVVWCKDMTSIVSERGQWMIRLYSVVYCVVLTGYSIGYLPPIDTMGYRVGTTIRATDETINFSAIDKDGSDKADDLLDTGYSLILTSENISEANDGEMDRINVLTTYALHNNIRIAMLTASEDESEVTKWREMTGAEYPILWCDETELRTMVRSNPGLMLIKDGVVMRKWSHYNIPEMRLEDFERTPEQQLWITTEANSMWMRIMMLVLWFFIPLTVWTILDKIYKYYKEHKSNQPITN